MNRVLLDLKERISKNDEKRKVNLIYLEDNEKLKNLIDNNPYFFSILHHSLELGYDIFSDYELMTIDYDDDSIYDTSFMAVAIDLFLKKLNGDLSLPYPQQKILLKEYNEFHAGIIEHELNNLDNEFLLKPGSTWLLYDRYFYFINYPFDLIIKKCLSDEEILNHLEKVKKRTLLKYTLADKTKNQRFSYN